MRLGLLLLALLATPAAAQGRTGYTIAYGIQLGDFEDKGVIERCEPNRFCEAKMRDGKTRLNVSVGARGDVTIFLHGAGSCCLFGNGDSRRTVARERRVQHLPLFVGRTRRGNEIIRNVKVGDLYIALSR